ncbi:hypothetical protein [Deinococcus sp.]|uniref:hypothetical protein n=1 Tax=Deinococcus sp. TaxID=47478 RepID=UPI00391B56AA
MSKKRDKSMLADKIVYLVRVGSREVDVDAASADELAAKLSPLLDLELAEITPIAQAIYGRAKRSDFDRWSVRRAGVRRFVADDGARLPGQMPPRKGRKPTTPVEEWGAVELPADDLITGPPTQVPQTLEPAPAFLLAGSRGAEMGQSEN